MLVISQHQLEIFSKEQERVFEENAVGHLKEFDPDGFGRLDNQRQLAALRHFRKSARTFGAVTESQVVLFAEIACLLGENFWDDQNCAWARVLLDADSTDMRRTLEYVRDTALLKKRGLGPMHA
jgi:hypothetical protein